MNSRMCARSWAIVLSSRLAAISFLTLRDIAALSPSLPRLGAFASRHGIDPAFRNPVQLLVGGFLFLKILFEDIGEIVAAQFARPGDERTVARDLVMLDGLRR